MLYWQPLEFIMNMKFKSCSARTTLWRDSIFVGNHLVWALEEESDGTLAFEFPLEFFVSTMTRTPLSYAKQKCSAIHFGNWVLLQDGRPLAYATAISEDKPMRTAQVFVKTNLEVGFHQALAFLITGILTMSGADVLQIFLLDGDASDYITPSSEMETKDFWAPHFEWSLIRNSAPFHKYRALCLSPSSWESHELGKSISEKLSYLKIRKNRWEETHFPKPKKVKRALIARIFRPKVTD
jgi:hypothetical protein